MKIRIDTYYDITCDICAKSWSTDFENGMAMNKQYLSKRAYAEGWKCKDGKTICPECMKKLNHK